MPQIKKDKLVSDISKEVARLILPRVKKIVNESLDLMKKDILLEILRSNNNRVVIEHDELDDDDDFDIVSETKKTLARRSSSRNKKSIQERAADLGFDVNDASMAMIYGAEDQQAEINIAEQRKIETAGTVDLADMTEETDPADVDYSQFVDLMEEKSNG